MDDRKRDGGTNFILRVKEQETRLTLNEHNDDDNDDDDVILTEQVFVIENDKNLILDLFQGNLFSIIITQYKPKKCTFSKFIF